MPPKKKATPARVAQNNENSNGSHPITTLEDVKDIAEKAIAAGNYAREQAEKRRIKREAEALENDPNVFKEMCMEKMEAFASWAESIFGKDGLPILVPTERASRKPLVKWKELDSSCINDEEWLRKMGLVCLNGGNIQVKLGPVSDHLVCFDVDDDSLVEPFLKLNPKLKETFRNRGRKGCHLWAYMKGEYPLKKRIYKDAEGRAIEFLTERSLCTLWGQHHATLSTYKVECSNPPITIDFNEIKFPEGMSYEEAAEPDYSQREHIPYDGPPGSRRRHGGYDFTGFNEMLQEDDCITQLLVEKYFEGARKTDEGWRCGDITGRKPTNGGSFLIRPNGHCTEWDTNTSDNIINAVCSQQRADLGEEKVSWEDAFGFLADEGFNFFKAPKEDGCTTVNKYNLIFNAGGGDYWIPAPHGGWHNLNVEAAKRYLKVDHEISTKIPRGGIYSPADVVLRASEQHHRVDLVGAYAGYRESKIYDIGGGLKMLVPRVVKVIDAVQGDWWLIKGFLEGLFPNPIELAVFRAWIKYSYLSLQREPGKWGPGQALVLLGNSGVGKTTCQDNIITPSLGREADPTSWFIGSSPFNAQLAEAEHWSLSDPKWSTKQEKENFASSLKTAVSKSTFPVHPKYQQERLLNVFKRISISINEEEESLSIFPLLPESTLEKIIFLQTAEKPTRYTPTRENYAEWTADVAKQLPAFLFDTLYCFQVPSEILDPRYGIKYRNDKIQSRISAPTTEERQVEIDNLVYEIVFQRWYQKDSRTLTPSDFCSAAHNFDFHLKEATSFVIPKSPVYAGKFLMGLTKRKCTGFTVEFNHSKQRPAYTFTKVEGEPSEPAPEPAPVPEPALAPEHPKHAHLKDLYAKRVRK